MKEISLISRRSRIGFPRRFILFSLSLFRIFTSSYNSPTAPLFTPIHADQRSSNCVSRLSAITTAISLFTFFRSGHFSFLATKRLQTSISLCSYPPLIQACIAAHWLLYQTHAIERNFNDPFSEATRPPSLFLHYP